MNESPAKCEKCGNLFGSGDIVCGLCGTADAKTIVENAEKAGVSLEKCNHRYIRSLQDFTCIYCGKVKPPGVRAPIRDSVDWGDSCGACGSTLDETMLFCTRCGAEVNQEKYTARSPRFTTHNKLDKAYSRALLALAVLLIGVALLALGISNANTAKQTETSTHFSVQVASPDYANPDPRVPALQETQEKLYWSEKQRQEQLENLKLQAEPGTYQYDALDRALKESQTKTAGPPPSVNIVREEPPAASWFKMYYLWITGGAALIIVGFIILLSGTTLAVTKRKG